MAELFVPSVTVESCERPGCRRKFERSDGLTGGYCSDWCLQVDCRYVTELPPVVVLQPNKYEGINPHIGKRPIKRYAGYLGLRRVRDDEEAGHE